MSVNYRAGLVYGFKLTHDEVSTLPKDALSEWMWDYHTLICLDMWAKNSDFIWVVEDYGFAKEGCANKIPHMPPSNPAIQENIDKFYELFPDKKDISPCLYNYLQVD